MSSTNTAKLAAEILSILEDEGEFSFGLKEEAEAWAEVGEDWDEWRSAGCWAASAAQQLKELGLRPDQVGAQHPYYPDSWGYCVSNCDASAASAAKALL